MMNKILAIMAVSAAALLSSNVMAQSSLGDGMQKATDSINAVNEKIANRQAEFEKKNAEKQAEIDKKKAEQEAEKAKSQADLEAQKKALTDSVNNLKNTLTNVPTAE